MNDKYSTATFCGVVLVALAVGVLVGKVALAPSPSAPQGPGGGIRERNFEAATAGESKEATIRLRDKGAKTCRSWLKGYADSYPRLSLSADSPKDSVDWTAQDEKGNPTDVVVTFFDINPNTGGPGSPFANGKKIFKNFENSGPLKAGVPLGDYPFTSISIKASDGTMVTCANPDDPGVHIDQ